LKNWGGCHWGGSVEEEMPVLLEPVSEGKLKALTAVHNYVVKRADGTTAAERFFGTKHRDAFTWLLQRLPDLPRPTAKRPQNAHQTTQ
jgi:hypothetical protein